MFLKQFEMRIYGTLTNDDLLKTLLIGRRVVAGSNFGGLKETQEMLDFCGKHNITAEIELIKMNDINSAMERLAKADVKYRFVIDIENSFK